MWLKRLGATCLVLGIGSFILPLMGMQFRLMQAFGDSTIGALALSGVGLMFLIVGSAVGRSRQSGSRPPAMPPVVPPMVNGGGIPPPVASRGKGQKCARCGSGLRIGATYCPKCGMNVIAASPPMMPTLPPAMSGVTPAYMPPRPARSGAGCFILVLLLVALIAGGIFMAYWSHSDKSATPALPQEAEWSFTPPLSADPEDPISPPLGPAAGSSISNVSVEHDVISADGFVGMRIHATARASGVSQLMFAAHFFDETDTPVRAAESRYSDSSGGAATGANFRPGGSTQLTAFLPYSALSVSAGHHELEVLAGLYDTSGRPVAKAPMVSFDYHRANSFVTRVRAARNDGFDSSHRPLLNIRVDFVSADVPRLGRGQVVARFRDSRGLALPGRQGYSNFAGALAASADYKAPTSNGWNRYEAIPVTVPAEFIPYGTKAEIVLIDPGTGQTLSKPVNIALP